MQRKCNRRQRKRIRKEKERRKRDDCLAGWCDHLRSGDTSTDSSGPLRDKKQHWKHVQNNGNNSSQSSDTTKCRYLRVIRKNFTISSWISPFRPAGRTSAYLKPGQSRPAGRTAANSARAGRISLLYARTLVRPAGQPPYINQLINATVNIE